MYVSTIPRCLLKHYQAHISTARQRVVNSTSTDGRHPTASLVAFTGRALMIFRAGFALKTVGSLVNGLMPLRAFVAGFLTTTNLANPGTTKAPVFLSSLYAILASDSM